MEFLLVFVLGVVFYSLLLPIIDYFAEIIETKKALYVSRLGIIINKNQITIQKDRDEADSSAVSAIGFRVDSDEDEDYDDDCDDKVGRIGF